MASFNYSDDEPSLYKQEVLDRKSPVPFKGKVTIGYRIGLFHSQNRVIRILYPPWKKPKKKNTKKTKRAWWFHLLLGWPIGLLDLFASGRALPRRNPADHGSSDGIVICKNQSQMTELDETFAEWRALPAEGTWVAVDWFTAVGGGGRWGLTFFRISTWWFVFFWTKNTRHFTGCFWGHHYNLGMNDNVCWILLANGFFVLSKR